MVLVAADAEALPFRTGAFDAAVIGFPFCTIPQPANVLGEVRRVVRPSGAVRLLNTYAQGPPNRSIAGLAHARVAGSGRWVSP